MPSICCGTVAPNITYVAQGTTGMRYAVPKLNPLVLDARAKPIFIAEGSCTSCLLIIEALCIVHFGGRGMMAEDRR